VAISMHSASVPVFIRMLGNIQVWLDKARAHAEARKFDVNNFLAMRLAPDMLPFSRQIQIATDHAKGCVARLAGIENPKYEDDEANVDQLVARLKKTIEFVRSVPAAQIDGSEAREISLPLRRGELKFSGEDYLRYFALPNFLFHCTTAYDILRHGGVELGKADFLGR
jgi:uncharacterized protein